MQLTSQSPNIEDVPAFLRAMAGALAQMHAEQRAHGSILKIRMAEWLDESGSFHAPKFDAARAAAESLPRDYDPFVFDVRCFTDLSIECIAGSPAAPDQTFQASFYLGKGWPGVFLQLLATISAPGSQTCVTMADLSRALKEPADTTTDPATNNVSNSGTPTVPAPPARLPAQQPLISIALRNATVGKPYQVEPGAIATAIAKKRGDDPEHARIFHLQLPDDCGLAFDEATGAVTGTPTRSFEGSFNLDYEPARSATSTSIKVTFLINPDPASLWKDLPPPSDAPYQKALLDHSDVQLGPFRIVAASRRGRSHANKGEFRDDDYAIGYAANSGWLVVVVADGAGSATYSRRGSQIACAVAKNRLVAVLNSAELNQAEAQYVQHRDWQHREVKLALRQSLFEAALDGHHKLRAEVAQPSEPLAAPATLRNYDTTLILLVMKKTGEGCIAATFAIGDGGAGILPHPGEGIPLTHADSGEHAGQTIFLTFDSTVTADEANLEKRFHLAETQEFAGALAMTDGITDPKFPSDASFADPAQWAALWGELQPVLTSSSALLDWMNFFSPGNHDDRTLVAVLPAQSDAPATP